MEVTGKLLEEQVKKLAETLERHKTADGKYDFDMVRVAAALDFAMKEMEYSTNQDAEDGGETE